MLEDSDHRDVCTRCGERKDEGRSRRGRTARRRGNAYERDVAARLGLRRTGQFGGPDDAAGEWLVLQAKNGGAFPERAWRWLQALPRDARLRAVVIGDAPGPGHPRREVIVLELDEFVEWFGDGGRDGA
jgi:hypothetical protein